MGIHGFSTEEVQELQKQVSRLTVNLDEDWNEVRIKWENLKSCWCDHQYERFEPVFEQLSQQYQQSQDECRDYLLYLKKKIDELQKIPTVGDRIETAFTEGVMLVMSVGSLIGSPPTDIAQAMTPPTSCVQNVLSPEDLLQVKEAVEEQGDQLGEVLETSREDKDERRRRKNDSFTIARNQPNKMGSA
jgi:hypothetical protein